MEHERFESASGESMKFEGSIETDIEVPDVGKLDAVLLIVKSTVFSRQVLVLIGTNVMRHLPLHRGSSLWKSSTPFCRKIYNMTGVVYCQRQPFPANSEVTLESRAKMTTAKFPRTVMCLPINNICNKKLHVEPILVVVPANQRMISFPVRVKNYTDGDVVIDDRQPVYKITCPDEILKKQTLSNHERDLLASFDFPETEHLDNMKKLIIEYVDVFASTDLELGCCNIGEHEIIIDNPTPFKEKYGRIPPCIYTDMREQLEAMLECGVIRESNSPHCSPITVVAKKDGRARICCDFRTLNKRTKKDAKSLPIIEETIDMLGEPNVFSTPDLRSGYWQRKLSEKSKELTSFTAGPLGFYIYEWNRLPFGLCNSGATFQRMIEKALHGTIHLDCIAYINDIVVFSWDDREHLDKLARVLSKLRSHGLKLKLIKCRLFQKEITYLGHRISQHGVRKDHEKTSKVTEWPVPECVKDVRRLLGFIPYLRKYIKNYAVIVFPLSSLLQGYSNKPSKRRQNKIKERDM